MKIEEEEKTKGYMCYDNSRVIISSLFNVSYSRGVNKNQMKIKRNDVRKAVRLMI